MHNKNERRTEISFKCLLKEEQYVFIERVLSLPFYLEEIFYSQHITPLLFLPTFLIIHWNIHFKPIYPTAHFPSLHVYISSPYRRLFNCSVYLEGNCTHFILITKAWSLRKPKANEDNSTGTTGNPIGHFRLKTSSKLPKPRSQTCSCHFKFNHLALTLSGLSVFLLTVSLSLLHYPDLSFLPLLHTYFS